MSSTVALEIAPAGPSIPEVDAALTHGLAWTGTVKWTGQAISWVSTLLVARLLSPEDYGIVGMAGIYLGIVALVSEFGLGAAVVALPRVSKHQVAQLNSVSVALGIAALAVSCGAAVPLGHFFSAPDLPAVVLASSTSFVISSFRTIPLALLKRELRFKEVALIDGAQAVASSIIMVVLAFLGFRYWTLVIGTVLAMLLATVATVIIRTAGFALPRWSTLREEIGFSRYILGARLSVYAYSQSDFLVAGRVLGKETLGFYSVAWTIASTPVEKITAMVGGVAPSIFAAVQHDTLQLRRYLLRLTEAISLLTFPASVGVAVVAEDFVRLVLGSKWLGAVAPLQLLALYASIRSISPLLNHLLTVTGDARFGMRVNIATAVALPVAFWFASHWGTVGIAAAWMTVHPMLLIPLYGRVLRRVRLGAWDYVQAIWPAMSASAVLTIAVLTARRLIGLALPLGARLTCEVVIGGIAYILVLAFFYRARLQTGLAMVLAARHIG